MLGVGILGGPWMGYIQNSTIEQRILADSGPVVYEQVMAEPRGSLFGDYRPIDEAQLAGFPAAEQEQVGAIRGEAKQVALYKVAVLPLLMLMSYLGLMLYFRSKGGYKAIELESTIEA